LIGVIGAVGIVALELKARIAHVTVADGRLRRRTFDSWRPGDQPIQTISRAEITPKGDVELYFNNKQFWCSHRQSFAATTSPGSFKLFSAAAGRDLSSQHEPCR